MVEDVVLSVAVKDEELEGLFGKRLARYGVERQAADAFLEPLVSNDEVVKPDDSGVFVTARRGNFDKISARLADGEVDARNFIVVIRVGLKGDGVTRASSPISSASVVLNCRLV